jgi:hypothetical protein
MSVAASRKTVAQQFYLTDRQLRAIERERLAAPVRASPTPPLLMLYGGVGILC